MRNIYKKYEVKKIMSYSIFEEFVNEIVMYLTKEKTPKIKRVEIIQKRKKLANEIFEIWRDIYNISDKEMNTKRGSNELVRKRYALIHIFSLHEEITLNDMVEYVKKKDHTSIIRAIRVINETLKNPNYDRKLYAEITKFKEDFNSIQYAKERGKFTDSSI